MKGPKTPLTQEEIVQNIQSNGPEKRRIVAVLAFELMKTGVDPLHVHKKSIAMLNDTDWNSNSGRSLAANLTHCYNEGLQKASDVKAPPLIQTLQKGLLESYTPPGSPPVSRLVFSALSSRSSDAMSISGSSLNDDHPNLLDKPLPELPEAYKLIDVDILNSDFRLPSNMSTSSRNPPTIPEEDLASSISEKSGSGTPKQEHYKPRGSADNHDDDVEDGFILDFGEGGSEKDNVPRCAGLWELKEVLEELQCDKDYIATLLTSAYVQGKKADLTYVRLKLD
ncbi:hypothetical protein TWF481_009052 [Arthrobotrys musiformis]|uniref:ENTH domain-containing protein n=1 Tax=Arthrobotrys musiformis TaxID=47236 RepID=A0AAV9W569_9PEZI